MLNYVLCNFNKYDLLKLHWVGFEPTRLSPYELESYPLDHSGTNANKKMNRNLLFLLYICIKICLYYFIKYYFY